MIIKFKNWETYNPRNDIKKPGWFRFNNDFLMDPKMFSFNWEEIGAVLYLLCEASRANKKGELYVSQDHARITSRVSNQALDRVIKKLIELRIIECRSVRGTYAKPYSTNDTDGRDETKQDETNETKQGELSQPPAAPAPPVEKYNFITLYCDAFKNKYNTNPPIRGKEAGIAKRLASGISQERALKLIAAYFSMNDSWFIKKRHDLVTMEQNLNAIVIFAETGKTINNQEIRAFEQQDATNRMREKILKGEL